jgi:hypothetical protein
MTLSPPPAWAIAAPILGVLIGIFVWRLLGRTAREGNRTAGSLNGLMLGTCIGQTIVVTSSLIVDYSHWARSWGMCYVIVMWLAITAAVVIGFRRMLATPLTPFVSLELSATTVLGGYVFTNTCNQLASIAPSDTARHNAIQLGTCVFFLTTVYLLMAGVAYLTVWTNQRESARSNTAETSSATTAEIEDRPKASTSVDFIKKLDQP